MQMYILHISETLRHNGNFSCCSWDAHWPMDGNNGSAHLRRINKQATQKT